MSKSLLPSSYGPLLADLKARVRVAQVKAAVVVNRELILLYWHLGREILRAQKAEGWGTKVVERLGEGFGGGVPGDEGVFANECAAYEGLRSGLGAIGNSPTACRTIGCGGGWRCNCPTGCGTIGDAGFETACFTNCLTAR